MDSKPDSHIWHIALMRHFVVVAPHKVRFATISPKFFWPQKMPCLDLNSILMWQKHHQGRTSKVTFCNVFLTNRKVAQDITPPKTKMAFWTNHHLLIGDAASNGCISIAILIFWESLCVGSAIFGHQISEVSHILDHWLQLHHLHPPFGVPEWKWTGDTPPISPHSIRRFVFIFWEVIWLWIIKWSFL